MTVADIKNLSNQFLSVNRIDSPDNQAEELFELDVKNFGQVYACIKDVTFGGRANLQDESRIQIHCTCNNYIYNQLQSSKNAIIIGVGKYEDTQIYCAFKPEFSNGSSTISKQIKKETIEKAVKYGFSQQLKGNVFACVFQSPFLPFYLNNYKWIHDAPLEELNKQDKPPVHTTIPFSHNRIIFGAPGTGKSNRLKNDSIEYFNTDKSKLYNLILSEINSSLASNGHDMGKTAMLIGMKYMYFFADLLKTMNDDQISEKIGITESILGGHARYDMYRPAKTLSSNITYNYDSAIERVTFHPNYSYAQFVGTYKPVTVTSNKNTIITSEQQDILNILRDPSKTGQEKYDLLYDSFKKDNLTRLPILLGLFTDDEFITKKADGTPSANENSVERNHGRAIRPFINLNTQKENEIAYEYVPGPFIRTYIKAKKTGQNVLLLIEEINRANVAAVFGDIFQLLDRDADGNSEYPITTSEDLRKFLAKPENLGGNPEDYKKLSIPSNMYIWATMNSADQGVLPMDAAFKRRWDFEYIDIDENENWDYEIPVPRDEKINWNVLRKAINDKLKKIPGVNEDKLLGPYFLSRSVLDNFTKGKIPTDDEKTNFIKTFKSKILMYLYEDVCKMRPTALFELKLEDGQSKPHYSDICKAFDENGIGIFGFKKNEIEADYKSKDSSAEAISEQA